jgi:hypothetical protein
MTMACSPIARTLVIAEDARLAAQISCAHAAGAECGSITSITGGLPPGSPFPRCPRHTCSSIQTSAGDAAREGQDRVGGD